MAVSKKSRTAGLDSARMGMGSEDIKCDILENLFCGQGKFPDVATKHDYYLALAYTVRDRLLHRWINTARTYYEKESRTVVYLSAEYLLGPQLGNNIINLGIWDSVSRAVQELGHSLEELLEQEEEPGLGNGGLGRLAACYMDSLASLEIPAIGYGIRYEFGIFDQKIRNGWQVEFTDKWLRLGNAWEIPHPEIAYKVKFGGKTEPYLDDDGRYRERWVPSREVVGMPCDIPVTGYRVNTTNLLRLWKAEACESFDVQAFNEGDYYAAVNDKVKSENITKVLYPNDELIAGKQLRLEQQYFFVSCSLQDMMRIYLQKENSPENFHKKYVIQLNDTHPSIGVIELMRLLLDEYKMDWEKAWKVTSNTFAYTNHTLLPEALEKWSVNLMGRLLPRHLEIIYEVNRRFLDRVRVKYSGDEERVRRMSLVEEGEKKYIRMANLACVGSKAINGVAELHTKLLKETVLKDFYDLWPEKFSNKTNGVTPRRFILLSNPALARLITEAIGTGWEKDMEKLRELERFADDAAFRDQWRMVKFAAKWKLADEMKQVTGFEANLDSIFDIQTKRIHEYKRQHLNILHAITLYNRLRKGRVKSIVPRTIIFGGKAAPGYFMAKLMIKLINCVADVINDDPDISDQLKVIFFPNFNVKNAQFIYPAADLSEQISTAGKEASGTGNMKFTMNGALTIGTLDGANIEIMNAVGEENFFLFGLTDKEIAQKRAAGYRPAEVLENNEDLREAINLLRSGIFSHGDRDLFKPLIDSLLNYDDFMVLADYASYIDCQGRISDTYSDEERWERMSILNVARIGKFSSDRAIREYCEEIWRVQPEEVIIAGSGSK